MTTSASANATEPTSFGLPAPLQVQVLLISWMLDRAGYDLASRPTVDLAFDAMLPKGHRKWIGSHESDPSIPPAPRGTDGAAYARQLAQSALEVAYVTSGASDAELIAYCQAMCSKGAVSWGSMAERIINCSVLLWKNGKVNPAVRATMINVLDTFIEEADKVVAQLVASGEPANPLPKPWDAFQRRGASKVYPRDGREFPQFFAQAASTLSPE